MGNEYLIETTNKPVLYHYTNAHALHSILNHEKLWVTRSDFLNDYMEKNYSESIFNEVISEIKSTHPETKLFFDLLDIHTRTFKSFEKHKYVLSLTENPDSLVLWSNYSNHDGYNIGFNLNDLTSNHYNIGVSGQYIALEYLIDHGYVVYEIERQKEIMFTELKKLSLSWENYHNYSSADQFKPGSDYDILTAGTRLDAYSLFFKHPSFAAEEEYRFIYTPSGYNLKDELVNFRVSNGVIVPYVEIPLQKIMSNDDSGKLPLHSITIGPKNNLDTAKAGIESYLKYKNYPDSILKLKSQIPLRF